MRYKRETRKKTFIDALAQRPKFRDRFNINVEQLQSDIDDLMERIRANPALLGIKPVLQITE